MNYFTTSILKAILSKNNLEDKSSDEFTPSDETSLAQYISYKYGNTVDFNRQALYLQDMLPLEFISDYQHLVDIHAGSPSASVSVTLIQEEIPVTNEAHTVPDEAEMAYVQVVQSFLADVKE